MDDLDERTLRSALSEREERIETLIKARDNAHEALVERDMKIKRMREDLEADRDAAQNSIAERDRELAKANQRIEKLHRKLEAVEFGRSEREAALEAARAENAELRKALVEKTSLIKGLREDLGSADKLREDVTQERDALLEDIDRLEKEVEDARSATGTLNSEHVRQRSRIVDLERQSASYRTAIRQLCAALEWATKAINDLADVTGEDIPF